MVTCIFDSLTVHAYYICSPVNAYLWPTCILFSKHSNIRMYVPTMLENKPVACFCVQGGPGQSGSGYGNFELIGPRGLNFTRRSTNWVSDNIASLCVQY